MYINNFRIGQLLLAFALLLAFVAQSQGQTVYVISEPSGGNQGTFTISLDHSLELEMFDCIFDSVSMFSLPINGKGFEVSNIQVFDEDDFAAISGNSIRWSRSFLGISESEISGNLLSFDVNFVDGVADAEYTIGSSVPTGFFDLVCSSDTFPTFGGDGIYFDSFGGRTFSAATVLLGDVNLDGVVDLLDVAPFVQLISDGGFSVEADINGDGIVDLLDIGPFVDILSQ